MLYPVQAFPVPPEKRNPLVEFADYCPTNFTHQTVLDNAKKHKGERWADTEDVSPYDVCQRKSFFMMTDNRCKGSKLCDLHIKYDAQNYPLNPYCRTGYIGRGILGKFGSNHAADPIVVRFNYSTFQFEFVAILRADTNQWAIPGGMVDEGEDVSNTLKREFTEEAGRRNKADYLNYISSDPIPIYKGYSDDVRNTDNAWIETTCCVFMPYDNCEQLELTCDNKETKNVKWISFADLHNIDLFASHKSFLLKARHVINNYFTLNVDIYKKMFATHVKRAQECISTIRRKHEIDDELAAQNGKRPKHHM